jgi:hypothetical protein
MPKYKVTDLVECCTITPEKVLILQQPLKDAKADFNLNLMKDVIAFIANNGLEELNFINSGNGTCFIKSKINRR